MNAAPTRPSNKSQWQGAQEDPKQKRERAQGRVRADKVLGGVDGNLHFPVPSMHRLNQTEPATFYYFAVLKIGIFLFDLGSGCLFVAFWVPCLGVSGAGVL
jgi:hypothetical protein